MYRASLVHVLIPPLAVIVLVLVLLVLFRGRGWVGRLLLAVLSVVLTVVLFSALRHPVVDAWVAYVIPTEVVFWGFPRPTDLMDRFDNGMVDASIWTLHVPDPGVTIREGDHLLRIYGKGASGRWVRTGITSSIFAKQSCEVSVDVGAVPGGGVSIVELSGIPSGLIRFHIAIMDQGYGYLLRDPEMIGEVGMIPLFGNEARRLHTVRIRYDAQSGQVAGYVDNLLVKSARVRFYTLQVALAVSSRDPGAVFDTRFDNFSMSFFD
jgi:hypothetical protein